jgi:glycerate kinase
MNLVIAPDKFKGSLSSFQVGDAVERGLLRASSSFHIVKLPMADGGDGLSEIIAYYTGAQWQNAEVQDPLGRTIQAQWLLSSDGRTAFIEMARASGLQLLKPEQYNPLLTSTFGTGQLIRAAIEKGVETIIIGIGGSATNDGGTGMAAALGYRFLDRNGKELRPNGKNLQKLDRIDSSNKLNLEHIHFKVACDVKNPLWGEQGASRVYAPQKGADPQMVEELEKGMIHFASVVRKDLGKELSGLEGGGAAGGLGAGCAAFLNALLISGAELVMQLSGLEQYVKNADWVITGEGRIDSQSLQGKLVTGVASVCKRQGKKLLAVCGSLAIEAAELKALGIDAAFPILSPSVPLQEAMQNADILLTRLSYRIGKILLSH